VFRPVRKSICRKRAFSRNYKVRVFLDPLGNYEAKLPAPFIVQLEGGPVGHPESVSNVGWVWYLMQSDLAARKDHASEFFASLNLKVLRAQSPTKLLIMLCMIKDVIMREIAGREK
jgi:hypothetical protein